MEVTLDGISQSYEGFEEFASALSQFDLAPLFELWISAPVANPFPCCEMAAKPG